MSNKQKGFTLVELAIALMVIGLLIGGVLKGQELIDNAKIIRTAKDIHDYDTAFMMFRSIYNHLPGDLPKASIRLPNCNTSPCNYSFNGIGQGRITDLPYSIIEVERNVWIHMNRAGLISSVNDSLPPNSYRYTTSPMHGLGGYLHMRWYGTPLIGYEHLPGYNRLILRGGPNGMENIKGHYAEKLDLKIDDGKPNSGFIQPPPAGSGLNGACAIMSNTTYPSNGECSIYIYLSGAN